MHGFLKISAALFGLGGGNRKKGTINKFDTQIKPVQETLLSFQFTKKNQLLVFIRRKISRVSSAESRNGFLRTAHARHVCIPKASSHTADAVTTVKN